MILRPIGEILRSKINIKMLKSFVAQRLPPYSPLREAILLEEDEITIPEFLSKAAVWLKILKWEASRNPLNSNTTQGYKRSDYG